jgi:hypothetical protein
MYPVVPKKVPKKADIKDIQRHQEHDSVGQAQPAGRSQARVRLPIW